MARPKPLSGFPEFLPAHSAIEQAVQDSLRHTFEDALREVDLHDTPIGNAIMGRTSHGTSKNYGRGFSTAKLAEAMEKVRYPGLELDHLH